MQQDILQDEEESALAVNDRQLLSSGGALPQKAGTPAVG